MLYVSDCKQRDSNMSFFELFKKKKNKVADSDVCGKWVLMKDNLSYGKAGCVSMIFNSNGRLDYCIEDNENISVICLSYFIEGDEIITDQPSSPKQERTRFVINSDGVLILDKQGERSLFKRCPDH